MATTSAAIATTSTAATTKCRFVILDADGGSDDAWALLLLLKAEEEQPEQLRILGITICGCGNTNLHDAARNMYRILKAYGRDDIPIFFGAAESLVSVEAVEVGSVFHGKDGFGDIFHADDIDIAELVETEHAVNAINQFCLEHPKQVTLIATGPLTNLALCYSMYGLVFANNVRDIYIMGGNYQGVGNWTRSAEFNFHCDPEAAHIVLTKTKCPMTILPWESCIQNRFFICLKWRLETFGIEAGLHHPAIKLLNEVETVQYKTNIWNPCDALLVAGFLFGSEFVRKESNWHAMVDLNGRYTRGQMILDHLMDVEKNPQNVRIIELIDAEFFKRVLEWCAGKISINLALK